MKEFGSDFHYVDSYNSGRAHLTDVFRGAVLMADGRQCLVALLCQYGWKRLWMPEYFCYEVVESVKKLTGIEVVFYQDNPLCEGDVLNLPYMEGDVLLRMNFFGMREHRSNHDIPVPVIEDHTHDLFGHWALYSDADWCISSIRKSLPIAEGGMMWSPKGHQLNSQLSMSEENNHIAAFRWEGMEMKARYLQGENVSKDEFRKRYTDTEEWFDRAEPSLIDDRSRRVVSGELDINLWQGTKHRNWNLLRSLLVSDKCQILEPEVDSCTMFSLILLLESKERRDTLRKKLIDVSVYPAILWLIPEYISISARNFSERMLSIHCDGRYTEEDIRELAYIVNKIIEE